MSRRLTLVVVAALVFAVVFGVVVGHEWRRAPTSLTTTTTATTTTLVTAQPETAIWPFASTVTRFGDPVMAAQTFATEYLGFADPLVGAFERGDSRSGEVPVRSSVSSAVTTVLVRQLTSADTWWVLGAVSPNIVITAPSALQRISSPVLLQGRSTAYEAVVNVEVRQDGSLQPLARDTVMGGSMGVMGPFKKSIPFSSPSENGGAIVMRTYSAKDGHVIEASVIRMAFTR